MTQCLLPSAAPASGFLSRHADATPGGSPLFSVQ